APSRSFQFHNGGLEVDVHCRITSGLLTVDSHPFPSILLRPNIINQDSRNQDAVIYFQLKVPMINLNHGQNQNTSSIESHPPY
ncbi:hypothetical protein FRB95_003222, partial [Tulasnella sp. JGI-2019a]